MRVFVDTRARAERRQCHRREGGADRHRAGLRTDPPAFGPADGKVVIGVTKLRLRKHLHHSLPGQLLQRVAQGREDDAMNAGQIPVRPGRFRRPARSLPGLCRSLGDSFIAGVRHAG